ncbi:MAG: HlyD family secretion protein [Pirellulaceae bacterium]
MYFQASKKLLLVFCLGVVVSSVGCQPKPPPARGTGDAPVVGNTVFAQGEMLPKDGFIQLLAQPGDTVESIAEEVVIFGAPVKAGTELVRLSSAHALNSQRQALAKEIEATQAKEVQQLSQARGNVELVEGKLNSLRSRLARLPGKRKLLELAKSQVDGARGVMQKLEHIARSPVTGEFVGELEIDRQRIAVDEAQLKYDQQEDALYQAELDLKDQISAAELELRLAREAVDTATAIAENGANAVAVLQTKMNALEDQIKAQEIRAPKDATVVALHVTEGGSVPPQLPVVELADLSEVVCQVEINERDASRVAVGNSVKIRSRAFKGEIGGRVDSVYRMVGRPRLRSLDPLARTDYRSVTAIVVLDEQERARDWLQLQVQVEINTEAEAGNAESAVEGDSASEVATIDGEAQSPLPK